MNVVNLDQLEHLTHNQRKRYKILSFFKEIKIFLIIFGVIFMGITVFSNANLFLVELKGAITGEEIVPLQDVKTTMYESNSISSIIDKNQVQNEEIQQLIKEYQGEFNEIIPISKDPSDMISESVKNYDFKFNTLPPTNRLIVPRLGVDDPILVSQYTEVKDFTNTNFTEELKQWVVKYPTTPAPWQKGNTLIFWHTSQERWKENPYGMAFAHIAKFKEWDNIQVVWEWKLYEYKVLTIKVVYPEEVNAEYQKYAKLQNNYLTLMWCYPIWTSTKRILVIAQQQ